MDCEIFRAPCLAVRSPDLASQGPQQVHRKAPGSR